jgi:hypothetical protein
MASRASGFSKAFTPRKRVKFQDQDAARDGFGELEFTVNAEVRANLQSDSSANTEERAEVTPEAWSTMCQYINVLADQLPILQQVIVISRQISAERSSAVEDEVGAVPAELGNGAEAPGGVMVTCGVSCMRLWTPVRQCLIY